MKDTLKKIECSSIEDLAVANALFRPGSIKYIDNYADRKKGIEKFEYLHPDLEPILSNTYGIIVFQEQLIEIGRLAKLSNPDELRKATAKKKAALLDKIKPELYKGLSERGWTIEQLNQLWDSMIDFAKYSFNKSHSAAYALIAYICMFLKTYHSKEFICSWLNSVSDKSKKIGECITEAIRLKMTVYLGKYDNCTPNCIVYKDGIMIGTNTIKFCNANIATELMNLTKKKEYTSFIKLLDDINNLTSINNRMLGILTGLNYFSDFGQNQFLLKVIDLYNGIKIKDPKTKKDKYILPSLRMCSQIKKDKIDEYIEFGLSEYLVKKYSGKETAKQYSNIDNIGLLKELMTLINNKSMSIQEQIKFEIEHLEYTTYINNKIPDDCYIVINFKTYKDNAKPYITLRNINTGEEFKTRIKHSKIYKAQPFKLFSVLKIEGFTIDFKSKFENDKWIDSDEKEIILESYEMIKE